MAYNIDMTSAAEGLLALNVHFKCPRCSFVAFEEGTLRTHLIFGHSFLVSKPNGTFDCMPGCYTCPSLWCGYFTVVRNELVMHVGTAHAPALAIPRLQPIYSTNTP